MESIFVFSKVTLDLERFQDADALDVGCGFGRWTAMLKSIGAKVTWLRNRGSASGFESGFSNNPFHTWRIIPGLGYVVNNYGDRKSPKPSYFPSEWLTVACKWWLPKLLATYKVGWFSKEVTIPFIFGDPRNLQASETGWGVLHHHRNAYSIWGFMKPFLSFGGRHRIPKEICTIFP